MFKVDLDLTGGRVHRTSRVGSVGRAGYQSGAKKQKVAFTDRRANSQTLGPGQVPQLAGQGVGQQYSPVFDRAEIPDLGQQFLPADSASQNKLFREIFTFDAIVGSAVEYWKDLCFSDRVILTGVDDPEILQTYIDATDASGIVPMMPLLLQDYLVLGRFVYHMIYDNGPGYWTQVIPHDLDYVTIQPALVPGEDPLIDLQPTADQRKLATSKDPRLVEQRSRLDPELVKFMAAGKQIPLAPENTMFLPRMLTSTDRIGTSYLTRVLMFKVYESAIYNASVAAARRRAGPLMHITAWENALDHELDQLLDLFFAAEEDPVNAKVVTKDGVVVNQIGGGAADYWKLSDEWPFLVEGKMRALGISENFLTGEANWNSMETIRTVFVDRLVNLNRYFTRKILIEKMYKQIAEKHKFVKTKTAMLSHKYRIAAPKKLSESDLVLPMVEWSRPLSPTRDQEYLDIMSSLSEQFGISMPVRQVLQAAGLDFDKISQGWKTDLEDRKKMYAFKRVLAQMQQKMGIGEDGNYTGQEAGGEAGGGFGGEEDFGFGGGEEDFGFGGEETDLGGGGGFEPEPGGGGGETAPTETAPEPAGGEGAGAGTGSTPKRFPVPKGQRVPKGRPVTAVAEDESYRMLGKKSVIDLLNDIPIWDEDDTAFGLPRKQIAKILYELAQTNPSRRARTNLAHKFYDKLRDSGLGDLQAQTVEYLAMRLGYLPKVEITPDVGQILVRTVMGKVNGHGLTADIKDELIALSRVINKQESRALMHKRADLKRVILSEVEAQLPQRNLLSGWIDPRTPFGGIKS